MRIFICDRFKISSFEISDKVEDFYTVNYSYVDNESTVVETLNFVFEKGEWLLLTDSSLQIQLDNVMVAKVVIKEYVHYELSFSDINDKIYLYVLPGFENYSSYSLDNMSNIMIGNGADNSICYIDTSFLENQIVIEKKSNGYFIKNIDNLKVYSYLNGNAFTEHFLKMGDVIFVNGLKIIWMNDFCLINKSNPNIGNIKIIPVNQSLVNNDYFPATEIEKNVKLFKENSIFFHTPRIKSEIVEQVVSIDAPPSKNDETDMPFILTAGSSILFGLMSCTSGIQAINGLKNGTMDTESVILELIVCGLMLMASLFLPILTDLWQKNSRRKRERKRQKKYSEYLNKKKKVISDIISEQKKILEDNNYSLDKIVDNINKEENIWNRNVFDNDFLTVSLGIGDIPANIEIKAPVESFSLDDDNLLNNVLELSQKEPILDNVPVTISVLENRVLPIIIDVPFKNCFINSLMLQFMYYYSGKDLKIVIFTNELNQERWEFVRYLPHCWDNHYKKRFFATSEDEMVKISMFLEQEYDKRLTSNKDQENFVTDDKSMYLNFSDYYLIITDDFKNAKDISIINRIINSTKNVGFSLLIFETSIKNLPSRLDKFVDINEKKSGIFGRTGLKEDQIKFDAKYLENLDIVGLSQRLANIPLYSKDVNSSIPSSLTFLDMYSVGMIDQLGIMLRWQNNDPTVSLSAPIGVKDRGKLVDLDLHEKFHGPHGLIAGSTGSGKSEFIITYILSMAVNYHPYEVQFILIDYKGGGLTGAFENRETGVKIPHLVGTITNLDTSEMNRTLVSISSELKRRQKIFNVTREKLNESTIDIYKYQRFYREGKVDEPMAHLFIISDEFAELKDQQPDFMDELISTARIGRSLGVHLILATQKPSGVVNDQIWSNTRFRVCLKVQTVEDSVEMLKRSDAASITGAGRFYLQVGNDELFELGQSGWAGAKYNPVPKITKKINDDITFVDNSGEVIKTINDEVKKESIVDNGEQLTNIVNYLYNIAKKEKIHFSSLWLPSLANEIYYGNLVKKYRFESDILKKNVVIGEYDNPSKQLQGLYQLNLVGENTIIFGMPGSGKENLLTTMMFSACINYSPFDVEFYILDFGAEVLKVFKNMPHVGDIIDVDSMDKISILFQKLEKEVKRRKELFADYAGDYVSYCRNNQDKIPLIVVVINSYESFMENTNSDYDDYLSHLLRECSKYGITIILSAVATNSVRTSFLDNFRNKILLQVQDNFDYVYMLGASNGLVPKKNFGRGIVNIDDEACEFQSALINVKDEINTYVKSIGNYLFDSYKYKVPEVRGLPALVTFNMIKKYVNNITDIPVGFDKEDCDIFRYNFEKNHFNVITGNDIISNVTCFGGIIDLIDLVRVVKMYVIDFADCINFEGNATFCNDNFGELLDIIIANARLSNEKIIYYMVGIGNISNVLSIEELKKFGMIMSNIDKFGNSYFIVVDDYDRYKNIYQYEWYKNINMGSGIWVGNDIDKQDIFNCSFSDDDINDTMKDIAYVVNNDNYVVIRTLGEGDDSDG